MNNSRACQSKSHRDWRPATHIVLTSDPGNPKWPTGMGCERGTDWVEVRQWWYVCDPCAEEVLMLYGMAVKLEDVRGFGGKE